MKIFVNSEPYNLYPIWKMWSSPITKKLSTPELLNFYYKNMELINILKIKYNIDKNIKNFLTLKNCNYSNYSQKTQLHRLKTHTPQFH